MKYALRTIERWELLGSTTKIAQTLSHNPVQCHVGIKPRLIAVPMLSWHSTVTVTM